MHRGTFSLRLLIVLIVAAMATVLVACGSDDNNSASTTPASTSGSTAAAGPIEVKVGVSAHQTGGYAIYDQPVLNGLELGVEDVNKRGKVKITTEIKDARSDVAAATITSRELLSDGAQIMVLACNTDSAVASGRLAQKAKIPAISTCASSPILTTSVGDYMFGNFHADSLESTATAIYARDEGFANAFVIQSDETAFTTNLPKYFRKVFEDKGGKVVGTADFSLNQQDFSGLVTRIKNMNPKPDLIYTAMFEPAFPAFMKQLRAAGVDTQVFGNGGVDTPGVLGGGKVMDGVVYGVPGFAENGNAQEEFNKRVTERFGADFVNSYTTVGYDLALVIEKAVETAGGTDPAKIRDGIASIKDLDGIDSKISYDYPGADGMPLKTLKVIKLEGGKRVKIRDVELDPNDIPKPF
jgi:branched-chain amino acid transport system substrate-binding protein